MNSLPPDILTEISELLTLGDVRSLALASSQMNKSISLANENIIEHVNSVSGPARDLRIKGENQFIADLKSDTKDMFEVTKDLADLLGLANWDTMRYWEWNWDTVALWGRPTIYLGVCLKMWLSLYIHKNNLFNPSTKIISIDSTLEKIFGYRFSGSTVYLFNFRCRVVELLYCLHNSSKKVRRLQKPFCMSTEQAKILHRESLELEFYLGKIPHDQRVF